MIKNSLRAIGDAIVAFFVGGIKILLFYIKQHLFGDSIPNYTKVNNSPIYRGGQPSIKGLKELKKNGINIIVNLRARNRDKKTIIKFLGGRMYSIHLPIIPFYPTESSVIAFLRIFIGRKEEKIYVHCFHGADRTGLMCAMYRIIMQGWDKEKAISEMKKNGFHFWQRSILKFIKNSNIEELRKKVFSDKIYTSSDELLSMHQN